MATCAEVITKAYRKLGARGRGEVLDAAETEDGLTALQSLYDEMVFSRAFGPIAAVQSAVDVEADEDTRVFATVEDPIVVTYPDEVVVEPVSLACQLNTTPTTRPPRDLSVISVADGETAIYSHARGSWDQISNLALHDFAPLSERSLDGLACLLAVVIADESQAQIGAMTGSRATAFREWVVSYSAREITLTGDYIPCR